MKDVVVWITFAAELLFCLSVSSSKLQVRLVGGQTPESGRVEINYNGTWGTVCYYGWNLQNSHVVCRTLGYEFATHFKHNAAYGRGTGPIWPGDIRCNGKETSINKCPITQLRFHNICSHRMDVGITCLNTTTKVPVRLKNGSTRAEGRVEVYQKGKWGTICNNSWDLNDGRVVCRMLGYSDALNISCCSPYGQGRGSILLSDLNCTGSESSIFQCKHKQGGNQLCNHLNEAGVKCSVKARLVGFSSSPYGRVEVLYSGVWGRVCGGFNWNLQNGQVICRMLGYSRAVEAGESRNYGKGNGPIWIHSAQCTGKEENIEQCRYEGWDVHDCYSGEALVICSNSSVKVRLVNGRSKNEGRVEIEHLGTWGTVCGTNWDQRDGDVVCRTLGYSHALQVSGNTTYGQGSSEIWLENVQCTGNETRLISCPHSGWGNHCSHSQEAGLKCAVKVRLADGISSSDGRLQVYYNEAWGKVCKHHSFANSHVFCRMLNFSHALYVTQYPSIVYGEKREFAWLRIGRCKGNENNTADCPNVRWGLFRCSGIGLICSRDKVRLIDGSSNAEGRVEILYNRVWSRVCAQNWDINSGHVVCRMLGYGYALDAGNYANFGRGKRAISIDVGKCKGNEKDLLDCAYVNKSLQGCIKEQDAGVKCSVPVRLKGGRSPSEGRVEVYYNRVWGTVEIYRLMDNANTVCRMLGFTHALVPFLYAKNTPYGVKTGFIWLSGLQCSGQEQNLASCPRIQWEPSHVSHKYDSALMCSNNTVRLAGGRSSLYGNLEVYSKGNWLETCFTNWAMGSSHLLCKTLGYPAGALSYGVAESRHNKQNRNALLNSVKCNGGEKTLNECLHQEIPSSECAAGKVVQVACSVSVRLSGGNSPAKGRVELLYNGIWGSVCDDGYWDLKDGHVVCRMLGYEYAMEVSSGRKYVKTKGYIILTNIACRGSESNIINCPHRTSICSNNDGVGVVCYRPTDPKDSPESCPHTSLGGYIGAVSFLVILVILFIVVAAVFAYRFRFHRWLFTKQTSKFSGTVQENPVEDHANKADARDHIELSHAGEKREQSNINVYQMLRAGDAAVHKNEDDTMYCNV